MKNNRFQTFHKCGFTLIELLVTIIIISILTSVAIPQYKRVILKSRLVSALIIVDAINKAEEVYYLANKEYTSQPSELSIENKEDSSKYGLYFDLRDTGHAAFVVIVGDTNIRMVQYLKRSTARPGKRSCRVMSPGGIAEHEVCRSLTGDRVGSEGSNYIDYVF